MNTGANPNTTGYMLIFLGFVVVVAMQLYVYPQIEDDRMLSQLVIAAATAGVALIVYNPATQRYQDITALKQGDTMAYVGHALFFGFASLIVMYIVDFLNDAGLGYKSKSLQQRAIAQATGNLQAANPTLYEKAVDVVKAARQSLAGGAAVGTGGAGVAPPAVNPTAGARVQM